MRPRPVIGATRDRKVQAAFTAIFERQGEEGKARLLAFCHLLDLAAPLAVRFDIAATGAITLTLEAPAGAA